MGRRKREPRSGPQPRETMEEKNLFYMDVFGETFNEMIFGGEEHKKQVKEEAMDVASYLYTLLGKTEVDSYKAIELAMQHDWVMELVNACDCGRKTQKYRADEKYTPCAWVDQVTVLV